MAAKDRACVAIIENAIAACNDKFSLIFGYKPEELANAPLTELFPRPSALRSAEALGKHRDGTAVWLRIVRLIETNTHNQHIVLIVEDISERKLHDIAATRPHARTIVRHFGIEA